MFRGLQICSLEGALLLQICPEEANPRLPPTEYIFYCKRAIQFLSSSKILTPHPPLRPASLSSPRNKGGGYTQSPGGERDRGSIFWKTREIGLPSYSKICTLCSTTFNRGRNWVSHLAFRSGFYRYFNEANI